MKTDHLKNKKILLLGKPRAFESEEFLSLLKQHSIELVKEPKEEVALVVEGRVMTPHEQTLMQALHKEGYTFVDIDSFEEMLARTIDEDVLLMSLKLSMDKGRLLGFLKNRCITDALFFRLLQMYRWQGEDFFENDDNRDVTAALIERFYENIERNHNVQFATTGLMHLVSQTQNSELLEVIASLEPLQYHPKIQTLLATHPYTPLHVIQKLLRSGDESVLEAVSKNPNVEKAIAKELADDEKYAPLIAESIILDEEMFTLLLSSYASHLAKNSSLTTAMQEQLIELHERDVDEALSQNSALEKCFIEKLYENDALKTVLLQNPATPKELLQKAFEENNPTIFDALAHNPSTPVEILQKLYETQDVALLKALAQNPSTPIELLYQMQLDSRYERYVRTNEAFGKHIQTANIGWL